MAIDDELDAVHQQHDEQPKNVAAEYALTAASKVDGLAAIASTIRTHFSNTSARERVNALLAALESVVRWHGRRLDDLQDRINAPDFAEALIVAVDHASRTTSIRKIERFARILGSELATGAGDEQAWEDAAAYVRDLAQLGEEDIKALQLLYAVQGTLFENGQSVPTDPNPYTEVLQELLKLVDREGFSRDEFYSRCSRLSGFGLALEVQQNLGRQAPGDHCFRLTGRARKLLQLLAGNATTPELAPGGE